MSSDVIGPSPRDGTNGVKCEDVRRWMRESIHSGDLAPPAPALSTHIEGCALCRGALLAMIAAATELPAATLGTVCQQCLEDLPAYIGQELEDFASALRLYPHVWWHLLTCRECAETYRLTRTLVEAERDGQLAPPPRPRQFASPKIAVPHIVHLSRQLLNLELPPAPALGTVMRGGGEQPIVVAEEDDVAGCAITLSVHPQADGTWSVLVKADPPIEGSAVLTFGERTFQAAFDGRGIAAVRGVPAALIARTDGPDLVVGITTG